MSRLKTGVLPPSPSSTPEWKGPGWGWAAKAWGLCQGNAAGLEDIVYSSPDRLIKHILSYTKFIKLFLYYGCLTVFHNLRFSFLFFFFFKLPSFSGTFPGNNSFNHIGLEQTLCFNGRIRVLRVNAKMFKVILTFLKNVKLLAYL